MSARPISGAMMMMTEGTMTGGVPPGVACLR